MKLRQKTEKKKAVLPDVNDKSQTWSFFNDLSPTYDLVNRVISFGQDIRWRRRVGNKLLELKGREGALALLDVATGTCELLIALMKQVPSLKSGLGIDLAQRMLRRGQKKLLKKGLFGTCSTRVGDAAHLPVPNNSVDVVSIAFGIRNVPDPLKALKEMKRVLKQRGILLVLEFRNPPNFFFRQCYFFYFRYLLPLVAGLLSRNYLAYRYLNKSAETFVQGEEFLALLKAAGFKNPTEEQMTFGIVSLYAAEKN